MDKKRFEMFRSDLKKFTDFIREGQNVDELLKNFLPLYPELYTQFQLPNLIIENEEMEQDKSTESEESEKSVESVESGKLKKKHTEKKDSETMTHKLIESVKRYQPWTNYTEIEISTEDEHECFETLKNLMKQKLMQRGELFIFHV